MIDKPLLKRILLACGVAALCAAPFVYIFFPVKEAAPDRPGQEAVSETARPGKGEPLAAPEQSGITAAELLRKEREELMLRRPRQEAVPAQVEIPPAEGPGMPPRENPAMGKPPVGNYLPNNPGVETPSRDNYPAYPPDNPAAGTPPMDHYPPENP